MDTTEQFKFLNSKLWIETTQTNYMAPNKLKHLVVNYGYKRSDWSDSLEKKILALRKVNSFPLFVESIARNFWFFQTDEIVKSISKIEKQGERLFSLVRNNISFTNAFARDAQYEEAIMSAIYEGANTTRSEAKKFIVNKQMPVNKAQWMIFNNFKANEWIKEHRELPLSKEIVLKIHEIVAKNTLDEEDAPYCGVFRDDDVVVGNASIHRGVDVSLINPSLDEVIELVTNNQRYLHPLLKGIILHYFVAYIHPFFDGNGRTARTLFYFKCLKHGLDWVNFLSISAALKEPGKGYENSFKLVKENDWDLTYFIIYSLKSLDRALEIVERKIDKLCQIPGLKNFIKLNDNQISLLQRLYLHHLRLIDVKEHANNIEKSDESARLDLKELVALDLLFEEKHKNRSLFYINKEKVDELITKFSVVK